MKNQKNKMKTRKLYIDKLLDLDDEKVNILSKFCAFCTTTIPILGNVIIKVVSDREPHGISTTAAYKIGKNEVVINSHFL